jgi:hypothetical protein
LSVVTDGTRRLGSMRKNIIWGAVVLALVAAPALIGL